eukprot:TRINITY_DN91084_c0_g1_i1.p1 TRINITY_DN91084_c0_g1~~TRINITY_DN91084_c0_g1_i1.p1  ORF type:complete len:704 (-),score=165.59 TRINITY_DN91084_c0_g1_i1:56-2167(-)
MAKALEDKNGNGRELAVLKNENGQIEAYQNTGDNDSQGSVESAETKRERIKGENLGLCVSILQFFLFIVTFSSAMLVNQSVATSRLGDHIRGKLNPSFFPITQITDTNSLFNYLEEVLVPALYENTTDTRMAEILSPYLKPVDVSNRMLGTIRLRQARVQQRSNCQVAPLFEKFTVQCYPNYDGGTESQDGFGPEQKFEYSIDEFGTSYSGQFATYSPNGFMQLLGVNTTYAIPQLQQLQAEGFMDEATRALFVEFNIWNSNVGLYAVVMLVVEFGASGGVSQKIELATMTQRNITVGGLGAPLDWLAFILLILVMIFVVQFLFEEGQEIYASYQEGDLLLYFTDAWNLLDWVNMILLLIGFTFRMLLFADAGNAQVGMQQLTVQESFQNISIFSTSATTVRVLNAFNCVLLWGKVTKYLRHLPLVKHLIKTVWSAFDLFMPFLIMFAVAFLGFVMAFNIGFGDKLVELSSFTTAAVYLCRAFLKDVRLMPVYDITPLFGASLILLFYVTMMLVGLALMFAMMADALFNAKYSAALKEHRDESSFWHEDEPLEEFFRYSRDGIARKMIWYFPLTYVKYKQFMDRMNKEDENAGFDIQALGNGEAGGNNALKDVDAASSHSGYSSSDGNDRVRPSSEELMRAIEHMSGRILSEITVVGIEIKSELHDVCERIGQMQMAVEELAWRTEKVRSDQEVEMAEPAGEQ